MASSCTGVIEREGDLVEQLPRDAGICCRDRLNGVADMDQDMVTDRDPLVAEQGQANVATNASGLTAEAV